MSCRGIFQLKKIHLRYCDYGGSSKGIREFLQSTYFKEFLEKNPQIELKVMIQRGIHPTLSSTYINGYLKEQPLRNLKSNEVLDEFFRARNSFGRKHLPHSGKRVYGNVKSIQGGWKANLWNNYPQHKLEYVRIPPTFDEEFTTKHFDPVKLARYRDLKDKINELYKDKEAHDS